MALIQFKRGLFADLPAAAEVAEPIFTTDGKRLYIGNGTGNALTEIIRTDENVKVGSGGTADYLSDSYFEQDGTNHIRIKQTDVLTGVNVDKVDGKDVNDSGSGDSVLWTAQKITSAITDALNGLAWQNPVVSHLVATPPGSPATGVRYIVGSATPLDITSTDSGTKTIVVPTDVSASFAAGNIIKVKDAVTGGVNGQYTVVSATFDTDHTNIVVSEAISSSTAEGNVYYATGAWAAFGPDEIVVYNGAAWANNTADTGLPFKGYALLSVTPDVNITYNGTSWVTVGSTTAHNGLSGLDGGTTGEYYHLTNAQHSGLTGGSATTLHTHSTTGMTEGTQLFYLDSRAEDAVGNLVGNTDTVNMAYVANTSIKATVNYQATDSVTFGADAGGLKADVNVDASSILIDTTNSYIKIGTIDGGTF